jgi:hypothetical protein
LGPPTLDAGITHPGQISERFVALAAGKDPMSQFREMDNLEA